MRAARRTRYGTPDVIQVEEIARPQPAEHEILVRVHAATVSRTDCALLAAIPAFIRLITGIRQPKRRTLGTDFAGTVEALGSKVGGFEVRDRVWGIDDVGAGSHAEYLVIREGGSIARMPDGLSFEDAVACVEGGWYAYSVINKVEMGNGKRVLINGATGAIGSSLLQLCVHFGATVTAVGNTKNLELLKSLGADKVIDYEQANFTRDDEIYNYVFDAVGKSTFGACKHLLAPKGVYISSDVGPGWQNPFLALVTPLVGGKRVTFPFPINRKRFFDVIHPIVEARHVRAVIDRSYTLDAVREAYAYAASGRKTGAVILKLDA